MVNDEAPQSSVSHRVELQQKEEKKRKDYACRLYSAKQRQAGLKTNGALWSIGILFSNIRTDFCKSSAGGWRI